MSERAESTSSSPAGSGGHEERVRVGENFPGRSSGLWRSLSLLLLASTLALAGLWLKEKREALSVFQAADQQYQRAASIDAQVRQLQRSFAEQQVQLGQVESLIETLVDPDTQRWQARGTPMPVLAFIDAKRQRLAVFVLSDKSQPTPAGLQLFSLDAGGAAQSLGMLSEGSPSSLFVPIVQLPVRLELRASAPSGSPTASGAAPAPSASAPSASAPASVTDTTPPSQGSAEAPASAPWARLEPSQAPG